MSVDIYGIFPLTRVTCTNSWSGLELPYSQVLRSFASHSERLLVLQDRRERLQRRHRGDWSALGVVLNVAVIANVAKVWLGVREIANVERQFAGSPMYAESQIRE